MNETTRFVACVSSFYNVNNGNHIQIARTDTRKMSSSFASLLPEAFRRPSNVDWCEANYVYSPWIAEAWNTASSVPMTGVAFLGLYHARQALLWESRWFWAWMMLAVVGVGSALFHATLLHVFQAADELPMLYCNLVFVYLMVEEKAVPKKWRAGGETNENAVLRTSRRAWLVPLLVSVGLSQTFMYFAYPSVYEVFMGSYVTVIAWLIWRSIKLAWYSDDSTLLQKTLVRITLTCYGGASALWVFENAVCGVHGEENGGWAIQVAHLHALWHIGACCGTYHFIQFCAARRGGALGLEVRSGGGENWYSPLFVKHGLVKGKGKHLPKRE